MKKYQDDGLVVEDCENATSHYFRIFPLQVFEIQGVLITRRIPSMDYSRIFYGVLVSIKIHYIRLINVYTNTAQGQKFINISQVNISYKILEGTVYCILLLFILIDIRPLRTEMWTFERRAFQEIQNKLVFYVIFVDAPDSTKAKNISRCILLAFCKVVHRRSLFYFSHTEEL